MIKGLTFDEARHQFFYQGDLVPSVTHILKDLGFYGSNSRFWTEEGRDRGSAIADAIDQDVRGVLDKGSLGLDNQPYFEAYQMWRHECRIKKIYSSEEIVFSKRYGFAGILDLRCRHKDLMSIVEIKTGSPEKWHSIQVKGYSLAHGKHAETYLLYLKKNGSYKFTQTAEPDMTWEHIMAVYRRKHG